MCVPCWHGEQVTVQHRNVFPEGAFILFLSICVCVFMSDTDLGDTCWLVSAGIKSREMIQLGEMKSLWCLRKCVYVCGDARMSRPASVLRSGCTAHLSALRNRQKAQFLCDTCTDVCQEIIHMPGGELFVLPINSCTPEQRTLHLRTLLQSGMTEEQTKTTNNFYFY